VIDVIALGPFTAGEKPPALLHTFRDAEKNPIDLSAGWSARFVYVRGDNAAVVREAVIEDAEAGEVAYEWLESDLVEPGVYRAEMWVGNGDRRLASPQYEYFVREALEVPSI
jgi:hypothetical protein